MPAVMEREASWRLEVACPFPAGRAFHRPAQPLQSSLSETGGGAALLVLWNKVDLAYRGVLGIPQLTGPSRHLLQLSMV